MKLGDLIRFVEEQATLPYNLMDRNCKHLAHSFVQQVCKQDVHFLSFCGEMEGRYEDWTHHPLAPFILHADRWNPEAFLPVVWASDHTEVVVSANQAGKLTELARGHFNKWLWKRATIPAPGLKGDQWVTFAGDCSKHIFYMLNNKLGELHIGPYNQWQWQYAEHHVESAEHGQPVMAGCNSGGSYVWWPGENSLYEFHKGHHNGWTWQQACHRRPDLLLRRKQPIAVIVNGACKKVFWLTDSGIVQEFHMGQYNNWQWELCSHTVSGGCSTHFHLVSCHGPGEHVFWASADDYITEFAHGPWNGWHWNSCVHKAPTVKIGQALGARVGRVFWWDTSGKLQQMHWTLCSGWIHKSLEIANARIPRSSISDNDVGSNCFLPNTAFRTPAGFLVLAKCLKEGDFVEGINGEALKVIQSKRTGSSDLKQTLVRLTTAQGNIDVAAGHRVKILCEGNPVARIASQLSVNDFVYVGSLPRALTKVGQYEKRTELFEIGFYPDYPVESFVVPEHCVQTFGDLSLEDQLKAAMPTFYEE